MYDIANSTDPMRSIFALGRMNRSLMKYVGQELTPLDKSLLVGFYSKHRDDVSVSTLEMLNKFRQFKDSGDLVLSSEKHNE